MYEKFQGEYSEYYQEYLMGTNVCAAIFAVGVITALLFAVIYYFIICNKSFVLAKRYIWAIVALIVSVTSYGLSSSVFMGKESNHTGFYASAEEQFDNICKANRIIEDTQSDEYREEMERYDNYKIGKSEGLVSEIAALNGGYTLLFFFIFSLLFKKHTVHGKAIPF